MAVVEQETRPEEPVVLLRCPSCDGLRSVSARTARRREGTVCAQCAKGRVVTRADLFDYWLQRFSLEEIRELAFGIWGMAASREIAAAEAPRRRVKNREGSASAVR